MKKNLLALLLIVTMLVNAFALTSCNLFSGDDSEFEEGKINITFYHTMGENLRTVLNNYVEEFEELYPFINVIHSQVGSYDDVRDTISTELTTGAQPNIAYCYPDHVALYNVALAVAVLDDYIDYEGDYTFTKIDGDPVTVSNIGLTQAQKDDFIQGYYEEGRQFGDADGDGVDEMYTLPLSKSTEVLYYNKDAFDGWAAKYAETGDEKYNIKLPTTWEEMEETCAKIKALYPDSTPLGYDSESNWFITMCEQLNSPYTSATGDHFLFDNEENRAFVKRFSEWHEKGYVTTQEIYGAYTSGLFVAQTGTKSYMSIGSSAGATHQRPAKNDDGEYPFEVGIATIPQMSADNKKVISQGPSVCIFEADELEVIASWLFVKFLTTKVEFQAEFGMASGYVPVLESVAQNPVYSAFIAAADGGNNIAALSAKVCLEQKDAYYVSPAFNGSSEARDQVGFLMQYCMTNYKTAADKDAMIKKAFEDAVAECEYMS